MSYNFWKRKTKQSYDKHSLDLWGSLTKAQQIQLFCLIMEKLNKSIIKEDKNYRQVLYEEFEFDSSSYIKGIDYGFLQLYNYIKNKN